MMLLPKMLGCFLQKNKTTSVKISTELLAEVVPHVPPPLVHPCLHTIGMLDPCIVWRSSGTATHVATKTDSQLPQLDVQRMTPMEYNKKYPYRLKPLDLLL